MMLDHLIEENELMEEMREYGLDENDVTFIKELIIGPSQNADETPGRHVKSAFHANKVICCCCRAGHTMEDQRVKAFCMRYNNTDVQVRI